MSDHAPKEGRDTLPHHRFELRLHIGASTWEDAVSEMRDLFDHIEKHGSGCSSVSGGSSASHSVNIVEDPEMTPERYESDLLKWMETHK